LLENRLDKLQPESDKPKTDEHLLIEKQIECNEGAISVMKVELVGLERRRGEVEQRGREQVWRDAVQVQAAVEVIKKEIRVIKRDAIRR
jgi:predicted metalloprotease